MWTTCFYSSRSKFNFKATDSESFSPPCHVIYYHNLQGNVHAWAIPTYLCQDLEQEKIRVQNAFNIRREGLNDGFDLAKPQHRSCILEVLHFEASAAQLAVACAFASLCLSPGTTMRSIFFRHRCTQGQNNKHRQGEAGRCWIQFHATYHHCREAGKSCVLGRLNSQKGILYFSHFVVCPYNQQQR